MVKVGQASYISASSPKTGPLHILWLLEQPWSISTKLSVLLFTSKAQLYHISSWYHWECQVRQESCRSRKWILEYIIAWVVLHPHISVCYIQQKLPHTKSIPALLERIFSISWFSTYEIRFLPDLFGIQSAAVELGETGFRRYWLCWRWWVQEFMCGLVICSLVCLDWHGCLTCCNQSMGTFND